MALYSLYFSMTWKTNWGFVQFHPLLHPLLRPHLVLPQQLLRIMRLLVLGWQRWPVQLAFLLLPSPMQLTQSLASRMEVAAFSFFKICLSLS